MLLLLFCSYLAPTALHSHKNAPQELAMALHEVNAHPRDKQVCFDAKTHTYSINGSSAGVTSVTTLLDEFFPKFDPDAVVDNYYKRWQQNRLQKYYGKSKEEIKTQWRIDGEKAAAEGTLLHAAIEAYYNEGDITYDQSREEWKHFLSFQEKHCLKAHRTEMVLWSSEHLLGGMIDLVVKNADGSLSIYDWKRTKDQIYKEAKNWGRFGSGPLSKLPDNKYHKHSVQLNLYRELLERYYGYNVSSMHIVRLHPSAVSFEMVEVERMDGEVGELLDERRRELAREKAEEALVDKFRKLDL